jgi:hypothetical protein
VRRLVPLLALVVAASALGATPSLVRIALTGPEVGAGYARHPITGSDPSDDATLNLCGGGYASEALRTSRRHYRYTAPARTSIVVSNDVVSYRHGGAQLALKELRHRIATCPKTPVQSSNGGPPMTFRLTKVSTAGLLPGAVAVAIRTSWRQKGLVQTFLSVAFYQAKGSVLSAVYTYNYAHDGTLATLLPRGAHAARASAAKLKRLA